MGSLNAVAFFADVLTFWNIPAAELSRQLEYSCQPGDIRQFSSIPYFMENLKSLIVKGLLTSLLTT